MASEINDKDDILLEEESGEPIARVIGNQTSDVSGTASNAFRANASITVPLIEETLSVEKQWVQAGEILVRKEVRSHVQQIPVELQHEELDIQRVPVNRPLQDGEKAESRQEGDTLIIPVVEEEVVVTKRYVVREELRITRRLVTEQKTLSDTVRKEQVYIEPSANLETVNEKNAPDSGQRRTQ